MSGFFLSICIVGCIQSASAADVDGSCSAGKEPQCDGPDIAFKKPAYLSSTETKSSASFANDGNAETFAHSIDNRGQSYLVIDLQSTHLVRQVLVKERTKGPYGNLALLISNYYFDPTDKRAGISAFRTCWEHRSVEKKEEANYLKLPCHRIGRYLAVERLDRNRHIAISDIKAFGEKIGGLAHNMLPEGRYQISGLKIFNINPDFDHLFSKISDGNKQSCKSIRVNLFPLIVDLGATILNPKVHIFGMYGEVISDFSIAVSDTFSMCKRDMVHKFRSCAKPADYSKWPGLCKGVGRYISFTILMKTSKDYRWLCEVTVRGQKLDAQRGVLLPSVETGCNAQPNLARGKPTFQHSVAKNGEAAKAVDGNVNGTYDNGHCSHTAASATAWWVVDLKDYYDVSVVKVWPQTEMDVNNFHSFSISLGMHFRPCYGNNLSKFRECYRRERFEGQVPAVVNCAGPARYVAVRNIKNVKKPLVLCEVEVFGSVRSKQTEKKFPWKSSCGGLFKDSNKALGKPFYSPLREVSNLFADGSSKSGKWTNKDAKSRVLLDLEAKVKVSMLRLHNIKGGAVTKGLEILFGNQCSLCSLSDLDAFYLGAEVNKVNLAMTQFLFPNQETRFILIRARNSNFDHFFIGEVEVFTNEEPVPLSGEEVKKWKNQCQSSNDPKINFAFKASVPSNWGMLTNVVDGKLDTCDNIVIDGWIVVDLGKVVKVSSVLLWGSPLYYRPQLSNVEVRILSQFNSKDSDKNFRNRGVLCEFVQNSGTFRPRLVRCWATGQYVAIFKHTLDKSKLYTCEIQVFGELTEYPPFQVPPMPNLTGTITDTGSPRAEIIRGVSEWSETTRATQIIPVLKKSYPILVGNDHSKATIVTSTIGKGRVVVSGHDGHPDKLSHQSTTFMKNLAKWMTNGATPHFHNIANLLRDKDHLEKSGCIILWKLWYNASQETVDLVRDLVTSGKASLILGTKRWVINRPESYSWYPLILEAGVYQSSKIVNYGHQNWKVGDISQFNSLPVERQLDLLLASTEVFLDKGYETISYLNLIPKEMLKAIGAKDKLTRLANIYEHRVLMTSFCSTGSQVSSDEEKRVMKSFGSIMLSQAYSHSDHKAPGVEFFPGDLPRDSELTDVTMEFVGVAEWDAHPTGLYLPPGHTLEIFFIEGDEPWSWRVVVGCHHDDNSGRSKWSRFPVVATGAFVNYGSVYSGFGGVLWVENRSANTRIKLRLKGAAMAPFFNLRDSENIANWDTDRRKAPGPWAELAGDTMIISVESKALRQKSASQLKALLTDLWDHLNKQNFHFTGTDWKPPRRHRFVLDIQVGYGSAHSGYPIMAPLSWTDDLLNRLKNIKSLSWGVCHEIGHNFQEGAWTFHGTGEVTNNVMCLYNRYMLGQPYFIGFARITTDRSKYTKKFLKAPTFANWKSAFLALEMYAQLAYNFGFALYLKVFRIYKSEKIHPKNDAEKVQTWIYLCSRAAGYNLLPIFELWGFPIAKATKKKVKHLQAYLPDDYHTKMVPSRVSKLVARYKGITRKARKVKDIWKHELKKSYDTKLPNDVRVVKVIKL